MKRAIFFSTADRYCAIICNFGSLAAVSRILTPAEIGLSVIGMAIVGLALSFREFASANYIIQHPSLKQTDVRGAFTVMLIFTSVVAATLGLFAPLIARNYGHVELIPFLRVVSLCIVLDLVNVQIVALLRRSMAFGKVATINVSGTVAGAVTTVTLALLGASYMSFAWGWLASSLAMNALGISIRPELNSFRPYLGNWREVVRFGGYNGATVFLRSAYDSFPYLVMGRVASPNAAALFGRSLTVCQIPDKLILGGAMSVILSAFSGQVREGRNLRHSYLNALQLITALHWPALMVIAILAYPIVDVLLGQQWHDAVPIVRIVAMASLFTFSFEVNYPVMVAMGAIKETFYRALIVFPLSTLIVCLAVYTGGLYAAAWSMLVVVPLQAVVTVLFVLRRLELRWREVGFALWKSSVVSLIVASGALLAVSLVAESFEMTFIEGAVVGTWAGVLWIYAIWLTNHPLLLEVIIILQWLQTAIRQRVLGAGFQLPRGG